MKLTSLHLRPGRLRLVGRAAVLVLTTGLLVCLFAVAAFAHHADVVADVNCEPLSVDYTATAWPEGETDAARTNPNIGVWYSVNGGETFTQLPHSSSHAFNPGNNFSFSGSFALSDPPPDTVIVRVRAQANWADGNGPGQPRQTEALPVEPCPPPPTTATTPTTSSTVTIASTPTTVGTGTTPSSQVGAETATGASDSLPVTGNSPIWLAAVALAALGGGIALIGRARVPR